MGLVVFGEHLQGIDRQGRWQAHGLESELVLELGEHGNGRPDWKKIEVTKWAKSGKEIPDPNLTL